MTHEGNVSKNPMMRIQWVRKYQLVHEGLDLSIFCNYTNLC
jgi:hypothetical protein